MKESVFRMVFLGGVTTVVSPWLILFVSDGIGSIFFVVGTLLVIFGLAFDKTFIITDKTTRVLTRTALGLFFLGLMELASIAWFFMHFASSGSMAMFSVSLVAVVIMSPCLFFLWGTGINRSIFVGFIVLDSILASLILF